MQEIIRMKNLNNKKKRSRTEKTTEQKMKLTIAKKSIQANVNLEYYINIWIKLEKIF